MLHCNGRCVLAKKLKQEEKKDQQNPERKLENKVEVFSWQQVSINILPLRASHSHYANYAAISLADLSFPIFHPPSVYFFSYNS